MVMYQKMMEMQKQTMEMLESHQQTMIAQAAVQAAQETQSAADQEAGDDEDEAADGEAVAPGFEQNEAVFAAAFQAQQQQYMQQMEFAQQVHRQGVQQLAKMPMRQCRFSDDFRPFSFCKNFYSAEGCRRADRCTYAHCFEELHPASPEFRKGTEEAETTTLSEMAPVDKADTVPDMKLKRKRDICHKWDRDRSCVLGKQCPFAHGESEIGTVDFVVCEKVKTKICKFWKSGKCIYQSACINAHGEHEIGTKRPQFQDNHPTKRRKEGESIEQWRSSVLRG